MTLLHSVEDIDKFYQQMSEFKTQKQTKNAVHP